MLLYEVEKKSKNIAEQNHLIHDQQSPNRLHKDTNPSGRNSNNPVNEK